MESFAKEHEARVDKLKNILSAKRAYLKALQLDIYKYQKKNEDFISKINEKLENHNNLIEMLSSKTYDLDKIDWMDKDCEAPMDCNTERKST